MPRRGRGRPRLVSIGMWPWRLRGRPEARPLCRLWSWSLGVSFRVAVRVADGSLVRVFLSLECDGCADVALLLRGGEPIVDSAHRSEGPRFGCGLVEFAVCHRREVLDYFVSVHLWPFLCSSMASWSRNHWPPIFFPPSFGASLRAWRVDTRH